MRPPSIAKSAPVMFAARSLARNKMRSATSSGVVKRPVTIWLAAWPGHVLRVRAGRRADRRRDAAVAEPQVGGDRAGADGVDADAVRPDLLRQRLGEARQRRLGRAVVHDRGIGQAGVHRAGVDDRAHAGREHDWQRGAGRPHRGHEVDRDGRQPVVVGNAQEAAGTGRSAADVVHQDVDPVAGERDQAQPGRWTSVRST